MQSLEPKDQMQALGLALHDDVVEALIRDEYQELARTIFMRATQDNCGLSLSGMSQVLVEQAISAEVKQLGDVLREAVGSKLEGSDFLNTAYYCRSTNPIACEQWEQALEAAVEGDCKRFVFCVEELQQILEKQPVGEQLNLSVDQILSVYDTCVVGFSERVLWRTEESLIG
ncbi:hypothetical protein [Gilvimarinus xylanilyticus]|uniref:Uncharacterized protein n=1 Tax=Gilvimarinus xylanilyticus TaxID=2944139 RepID=A0A9X2KWP8_9GAMM|nr:hypothetical protein [Gilvimarinus xylanilyticus]MCP8899265.1 hypothetical protein [Gilvimarinus xylanilyticus]